MTTAKEADAIYGQMAQRRKAERRAKPDRVYHAYVQLSIGRPGVECAAGQIDGQVCAFSDHDGGVGVSLSSSSSPDSDGGFIHGVGHLTIKQAILLRRLLDEAIREAKAPAQEDP